MTKKKDNDKKNSKNILIGLFCLIMVGLLVYKIYPSYSVPLDNDVRIDEESDLTYYLNISYDGKDEYVTSSSNTAKAEVFSDYIYIEDKLPDGLVFKGFTSTADGTIGAVERNDPTKACSGYVVDGSNGLTYDEATRTVSFKVKELQAGCKISVGIQTTTPSLGDKKRMDFYNNALAKEGSFGIYSNTVHTFIGKRDETLYKVKYQYTGEVPDNAPPLPNDIMYAGNTIVGVLNNVLIDGYEFSGWSSTDVTIHDNSFTMPQKEVTLTGSFAKKENYDVIYLIEGSDKPFGFEPPKRKGYGLGDDVKMDSLKVGDEVGGYRFLGWKSDDITLPEEVGNKSRIFTMPNKDVTITGKFERISYKVTYKFQGSMVPPASESLLPAEEQHYPGDTVTLAPNPEAEGYKFLGWYREADFKMPAEDVVVYGEWQAFGGVFSPEIKKEVVDKKDSYSKGEKVSFQITVTNTEDYAIHEVMLEEQTEGCYFIEGEEGLYEVPTENWVTIPTINPKSSVTVKAEYIAGEEVSKKIENVVKIQGATSEGSTYFDDSVEHKATANFYVANLGMIIHKVGEEENPLYGAEFTLYNDEELTNEIATGLEFSNLSPGRTYYLKETKTPTGYKLLDKILEVDVTEEGFVSILGYTVSNENGIAEVTIANERVDILPNTGGVGVLPFVLSGLIILIIGSVGVVLNRKRRRKK